MNSLPIEQAREMILVVLPSLDAAADRARVVSALRSATTAVLTGLATMFDILTGDNFDVYEKSLAAAVMETLRTPPPAPAPSSGRAPCNISMPVCLAVYQALECAPLKILLHPLHAHPRDDPTIPNLVRGALAYAEGIEAAAITGAQTENLFDLFSEFMHLARSHRRIFYAHQWLAAFICDATAATIPSCAQIGTLVRALLQCVRDLDAAGVLYPASETACDLLVA